ncbi:MAG: SH3 domain-containing protein [Gammaproteobacteria bacterium]|nr:SH3 domain-containing protein [Gammaproteobacteria bacterium]MDH5731136.1 SH3 domain-containing protein [Gammaproteobacteria bacterium]
MKKLIFLVLGMMLSTVQVHAEDDVLYVLSARAKMFAEPSFNASAVSSITKGEKVISLDKNNRWFKVSYKGKEGWMSRLSVSPHPPMKRASRLATSDETLSNESRRRASAVSSTAAIRGLRADNRSRMSDSDAVDFAALEQVENLQIAEDEIISFLDKR